MEVLLRTGFPGTAIAFQAAAPSAYGRRDPAVFLSEIIYQDHSE
jgi:hypothetical protein